MNGSLNVWDSWAAGDQKKLRESAAVFVPVPVVLVESEDDDDTVH